MAVILTGERRRREALEEKGITDYRGGEVSRPTLRFTFDGRPKDVVEVERR